MEQPTTERAMALLLVPAIIMGFLLSILIADTWPIRGLLTPVLSFVLLAMGTWIWRRTD
ncbi:hypothetical protein [Allorhizocola rhizosphaerae]|uniref:hypothetical protein n=1 Tax=Allorhizocola rhizosphaerae TaxID=1872709 RepID=UPI0013C37A33|nr:hypothetical protein [Allorhizocola rhizosphaerae]